VPGATPTMQIGTDDMPDVVHTAMPPASGRSFCSNSMRNPVRAGQVEVHRIVGAELVPAIQQCDGVADAHSGLHEQVAAGDGDRVWPPERIVTGVERDAARPTFHGAGLSDLLGRSGGGDGPWAGGEVVDHDRSRQRRRGHQHRGGA